MARGEKQRFTVLDLLQLDLKENDALDLRCIGGRPGLVREIGVTGDQPARPRAGGVLRELRLAAHPDLRPGRERLPRSSWPATGGGRTSRRLFSYASPAASSPTPWCPPRTSRPSRRRRSAPCCRPRCPRRSSPCGYCGCCPPSSPPSRTCTARSWRCSASACSSRATAAWARARPPWPSSSAATGWWPTTWWRSAG